VLIALAGRSPALDVAVIERLAAAPSAAAAAALRDLESAARRDGRKAVVKEARRALYRFTQRGIDVPPPPAPEPTPRRTIASPVEGYVSSIDGRGDRLVWIVRPQRGGGLVVLTAVLNEPGGLRDVAIAELPRKTLRRMESDLQARHGLRMIAADGLYCDALLAEGFTRGRDAGTAGIGEYPTYRMRLLTTEPAPRDPPLAARVLAMTSAEAADAVARGATLLDAPEFRTWPLERAALAPHLSDIAAARESPLVLSRPQQEERVRAAMLRAVRELFAGASGHAYRRRLEEMAYYLFATQRRELAVIALATAGAVATASAGGEGIPFFEELTRRSIAVLAEEDATRAASEAEQSVLIRPGAPDSARRPRRPVR
jgi:hypothetical protein